MRMRARRHSEALEPGAPLILDAGVTDGRALRVSAVTHTAYAGIRESHQSKGIIVRSILAAFALLALCACATTTPEPVASIPAGGRYVALGSSYAAGVSIGPIVAEAPKRCGRTQNNYPHLVAAAAGLDLVDVSCSGATTAHILGPWNELPAQIDAVTSDTRLVTVTIGGNDLNYVMNLMRATCGKDPMMTPAGRPCPAPTWPVEADYTALSLHMRRIAQEVRRRAPQAKLVFVDYLTILPNSGVCANVPVDDMVLARSREIFRRLAEITKASAAAEGATLLPASAMSADHGACSQTPWTSGYPGRPVAWHPTAAGHAAVAQALLARLR